MALFQPARRSGSATATGATGTSEIPAKPPTRRAGGGYEAVHASRDFWTIRRRAHSFITPACVAFLTWYFLFVILAVFAPGFMRISVFGDVNMGLCLGVSQFLSTFTIAVCYRSWARRRLDPLSDRLRRRLEDGQR